MELGWSGQLHSVYGAYVTFVYVQDWMRLFAELNIRTYKVPYGYMYVPVAWSDSPVSCRRS